jgi:hypothetical protein
MAFSASAPFARALSHNAFEASVQSGLIGEAALAGNFCERQTRGQQETLDCVDAAFYEPTVRWAPEGSPKGMGKMAYR